MKKSFSPEVVAKAKELREQGWHTFLTAPSRQQLRLGNNQDSGNYIDILWGSAREWEAIRALGIEKDGVFGREVLQALDLLSDNKDSLDPETIKLTAADCGVAEGQWAVELTLTGREKLEVQKALEEINRARATLLRTVQRHLVPRD